MDIEDGLERHNDQDYDDKDSKGLSWPVKVILTLFLLLLLIMWTFSYYAGKIDPAPKVIPAREEVVPHGMSFSNSSTRIASRQDYYKFILYKDQDIKRIADRISARSCGSSRVCQAKAIYYFIRNNYEYIADPVDSEYVEDPKEFLSIGGGDCESGTIALSSLLESIGISTEMVFIPGHAFLKIKLPEASRRYQKDGWVYLDWTCNNCEFGVVP